MLSGKNMEGGQNLQGDKNMEGAEDLTKKLEKLRAKDAELVKLGRKSFYEYREIRCMNLEATGEVKKAKAAFIKMTAEWEERKEFHRLSLEKLTKLEKAKDVREKRRQSGQAVNIVVTNEKLRGLDEKLDNLKEELSVTKDLAEKKKEKVEKLEKSVRVKGRLVKQHTHEAELLGELVKEGTGNGLESSLDLNSIKTDEFGKGNETLARAIAILEGAGTSVHGPMDLPVEPIAGPSSLMRFEQNARVPARKVKRKSPPRLTLPAETLETLKFDLLTIKNEIDDQNGKKNAPLSLPEAVQVSTGYVVQEEPLDLRVRRPCASSSTLPRVRMAKKSRNKPVFSTKTLETIKLDLDSIKTEVAIVDYKDWMGMPD